MASAFRAVVAAVVGFGPAAGTGRPIEKSGTAGALPTPGVVLFGASAIRSCSKWLLSPFEVKLQVISDTRRMEPPGLIVNGSVPVTWLGLWTSLGSSPVAGSVGKNGARPSSETRCAKLRTPARGT